jgi:putative transposase
MKPLRRAAPNAVLSPTRTFFVTTKTSMGRRLLQSDRNAMLFVDVLRGYAAQKKFKVLDFVVMPDHVHMLVTVGPEMTIEQAMQFIKGGFSYRLKKETGYSGEIWQRGFSDVRVENRASFEQHRIYILILENPVKAGLCESPEQFPYSFRSLVERKRTAAKAGVTGEACGPAEAVP